MNKSFSAHSFGLMILCILACTDFQLDQAAASELEIGNWQWSLPSTSGSGTASATATIHNRSSGGNSGSIGLRLRLSTQPYAQGGTFYEVARADGLDQLSGGFRRDYSFSDSFDLNSVPDGTYNIVLVVSEYTGAGASGYTIRDGATASSTFLVSSSGGFDPDPGTGDVCADNGWYGDGECDTFCLLPDPDCSFSPTQTIPPPAPACGALGPVTLMPLLLGLGSSQFYGIRRKRLSPSKK